MPIGIRWCLSTESYSKTTRRGRRKGRCVADVRAQVISDSDEGEGKKLRAASHWAGCPTVGRGAKKGGEGIGRAGLSCCWAFGPKQKKGRFPFFFSFLLFFFFLFLLFFFYSKVISSPFFKSVLKYF